MFFPIFINTDVYKLSFYQGEKSVIVEPGLLHTLVINPTSFFVLKGRSLILMVGSLVLKNFIYTKKIEKPEHTTTKETVEVTPLGELPLRDFRLTNYREPVNSVTYRENSTGARKFLIRTRCIRPIYYV